jgi:hypothetical protein
MNKAGRSKRSTTRKKKDCCVIFKTDILKLPAKVRNLTRALSHTVGAYHDDEPRPDFEKVSRP